MDINLSVPKNQQCFEFVDIIDRISKLPDEILAKILSYLPTKQAVATSILSKRWEYLWTLTSNLDFSDRGLADYKDEDDCIIKMRSLQKYVDRVIFYHGGLDIRRCHLNFLTKYFVSSVYSWICAVIACNIQELSLWCFEAKFGAHYQLPWRLFSCNTLVVLKIYGSFVIDVPTYVCFPRLKVLEIGFAVFVDDASTKRLFSSCPVLEELTIIRWKDCLENVDISVPSLKRLFASGMYGIFQITNTPCLEHLEINGDCRFVVNFSSSLIHAKLGGLDIHPLNAISQVETLILPANDRSLQNIIGDSTLPVLKNLKRLELGVRLTSRHDWNLLPNILDSSPNLQVLIFTEGLVTIHLLGEDFNHFTWHRPESVPKCLSMHLKTIEIFQFLGFPEELQLVEYLLECGKVLEKLILHRFVLSKHPTMQKKVEGNTAISELLSLRRSCSPSEVMGFERSSSTCEVIFTD